MGGPQYEVVQPTRFRRVAAKRLRRSHADKPPVTLHRSVSIQPTLDALEQRRVSRADHALRPTLTAVVALLVARALREDPTLNARREEDELRRFSRVDLAIAVATDDGLVAPVVRDPEARGLHGIAADLGSLAEAARSGGLSPEALADPTFTLTGLGPWGVEYFTPIINPPQIAILGVGALQQRLELIDGSVTSVAGLPLSLTFDHAEVDGVDGARFLQRLADHFASPDLGVS